MHAQIDLPLVEAAIDDVAAVIGDGRTHAGVDKVADLGDDLRILGAVCGRRVLLIPGRNMDAGRRARL